MRVIPLTAIPNQSFTATINGERWKLSLKSVVGGMCVDIEKDGKLMLAGSRITTGEPLIPYEYLQTGNFLLLTVSDDLADFSAFGVSQFLVYFSSEEIAALPPAKIKDIIFDASSSMYLMSDDGFYLTTDTGEILTDG